jgi:hypothetical protein
MDTLFSLVNISHETINKVHFQDSAAMRQKFVIGLAQLERMDEYETHLSSCSQNKNSFYIHVLVVTFLHL